MNRIMNCTYVTALIYYSFKMLRTNSDILSSFKLNEIQYYPNIIKIV
jgi:hypothetical protein